METVTGYQWGDNLACIGPYTFPVVDLDAIHMPPHTTLKAPPTDLAEGQEAAWDAEADAWITRAEESVTGPTVVTDEATTATDATA